MKKITDNIINHTKDRIVPIIVVLLILMSLGAYVNGSAYVYETGTNGSFAILNENDPVTQTFYVDGRYSWKKDSYGVYFSIFNQELKGDVHFSLSQNGQLVDEKYVSLKSLNPSQWYFPKMKFDKLSAGEAEISVILTEPNEDVCLNLCNLKEGMYEATGSSITQEGQMIAQYFYLPYRDKANRLSLPVYILLALLLTVGLPGLISTKKIKNITPICLVLAFVCMQFLKNPVLFFEPSYAESMTNYMGNALHHGIGALKVSDANYLPLLERVITLVLVNVLHISPYASLYIMQYFAYVAAGCLYAFFIARPFDKVMDVNNRYALILSIMLGSYYFETMTFINYIIYGAFLLLFYISDTSAWKKYEYAVLCVAAALVCLSKGSFVVLLPGAALVLILFNKRLNKREVIFSLVLMLTSVVQLAYSLSQDALGRWGDESASGVAKLIKLCYGVLNDFVGTVFMTSGSIVTSLDRVSVLLCCLAVVFLICLLVKYINIFREKKDDEYLKSLLIITVLILGFCGFFRISLGGMDPRFAIDTSNKLFNESMTHFEDYSFADRHTAILYALSVAFVVLLLVKAKEKWGEKTVNVLCLVWCIIILAGSSNLNANWILTDNDNGIRPSVYTQLSELSAVRNLKETDYTAIPVMPSGWLYNSGEINMNVLGEDVFGWAGESADYDYGKKGLSVLDGNLATDYIVTEVFCGRANRIKCQALKLTVYGENDAVLAEKIQCNPPDRRLVAFRLDEPLLGVERFEITAEDGSAVALEEGIYVGSLNMDKIVEK